MTEPRTTWGLVRYFLYLGSLGFGGPVALIGYMQRDLVERRQWFDPADYMKGLALSQLAPGPLAAQLAMCLGYAHGRLAGATLVGLAFIGPSLLMTLALGALYVAYGGLPWMQAAFYGVGAAVIGIIVRSAWKLMRLTMGRDRLLWAVAGLMAVVTAWSETEVGSLFILCGVVVLLLQAPPRRLLSGRGRAGRCRRWCRSPGWRSRRPRRPLPPLGSRRSCGSSRRQGPSCSAADLPSCRFCMEGS
jgi:chromate transporter